MPDYSKGKIYKLTTPHDPELVYYGSTVLPLHKRKSHHKEDYIKKNAKITSKQLFDLSVDDVIITLVENVNCNSKEELYQRERFYIENNNCINKQMPGRTKKEWYTQPHIIAQEKERKTSLEYKLWQKQYDEKRKNDPIRKEKQRLYSKKHYQKVKNEKLNQ